MLSIFHNKWYRTIEDCDLNENFHLQNHLNKPQAIALESFQVYGVLPLKGKCFEESFRYWWHFISKENAFNSKEFAEIYNTGKKCETFYTIRCTYFANVYNSMRHCSLMLSITYSKRDVIFIDVQRFACKGCYFDNIKHIPSST